MLSHRLKYQIEIWQNVEQKDSIGALVSTPVLLEKVMSDYRAIMGKVTTNDDRVLHTSEAEFIIRNYPVVSYDHFIKFAGSEYQIIAIQPLPDGSGQIIKTSRNG